MRRKTHVGFVKSLRTSNASRLWLIIAGTLKHFLPDRYLEVECQIVSCESVAQLESFSKNKFIGTVENK